MSNLDAPQSFGYQQTLMYGQYSKDLLEETRLEIEKLKKQKKEEEERAQKPLPEEPSPILTSLTRGSPRLAQILQKLRTSAVKIRVFLFTHVVSEDWFFLAVLGLIMALLAYAIDYAILMSVYAHKWLYDELGFSQILQYVAWVLFTIVFILFSTGYVHIVSPNAIGSGIPEMKTILRGVILKEYLSFRTGISKVIGLVAALGSGLPFGREGPFVHLSSIIATLLGRLSHDKGIYENESRQTEMLAAACAVGVACTFSAPIGGVLFSIEVTASLFAVANYWRGFFAAVWSALMFRLLQILEPETVRITALFQTSFVLDYTWHIGEILAYVFLGIMCGVGGALFVNCHRRFVLFVRGQRTVKKFLQRNRFIYPFLVALLVSSVTCPVTLGKYFAGGLSQKEAINHLFSNFTWTSNDPNVLQQAILSNWRSSMDSPPSVFVTLVLFFLMNFWMSVVSITLPVPNGCFIPVFVLGACLGRITGEAMALWYPEGLDPEHGHAIIPGGYAVVGAAAFSGAATHTISTTVIVCELTGQIKHILPLTCAVLIANFVAKALETNIFDSIICIKKLPYLPKITLANSAAFNIYVDNFMIKGDDLFYVTYTSSTYKEIQTLLKTTKLRSYPLVDSHQHMILLGSVVRAELQILLDEQIGHERRLLPPDEGSERSTPVGSSPAAVRRNRSSTSILDDIPNFSGLEQVKKQLLALSKLTPPGIGNAHDPKSAPGTVRGLPKFDAKPVKSILKRNQSVDDSAEESASTSKFFLGDSNSTMNTEVTPSPVIPRKSAMKKYNPYHTFSGISAAALAPEQPSTNLDSTISIGPGTTKETKKNPLSQIFQPLTSDSPRMGIRTSVSSLFKNFGNKTGSSSQFPAAPPTMLNVPRRKPVCELSETDQMIWEERQLEKTINYQGCVIDPAPFQLVAHTSLHKVHSLFSLLSLKQAYVTNIGRLVGVVSLMELRQCIEGTLSGRVIPTPIVPPMSDDEDPITEIESDNGDAHDDDDDSYDGGADELEGFPMGPSRYSFGADRVRDADQQRLVVKSGADDAEVVTSPAGLGRNAGKSALRKVPVLEPLPKIPFHRPSRGLPPRGADGNLSRIFEKPRMPDIHSAPGSSSSVEGIFSNSNAVDARPKEDSDLRPKSGKFDIRNSPALMVTPVTPPVVSMDDPMAGIDDVKKTHSPSRVQGSRFRKFVVDESKLASKPEEDAAAADRPASPAPTLPEQQLETDSTQQQRAPARKQSMKFQVTPVSSSPVSTTGEKPSEPSFELPFRPASTKSRFAVQPASTTPAFDFDDDDDDNRNKTAPLSSLAQPIAADDRPMSPSTVVVVGSDIDADSKMEMKSSGEDIV